MCSENKFLGTFYCYHYYFFENKRIQVVTKQNLLNIIAWPGITEKLTRRQKIFKTGIAFSKQTGYKKYNLIIFMKMKDIYNGILS